MDRRRLKLFFLITTGVLVGYAVIFPVGEAVADSGLATENKAAILQRVANYRSWNEVSKAGENALSKPFTIEISSAGG